jgi:hypothetical protein
MDFLKEVIRNAPELGLAPPGVPRLLFVILKIGESYLTDFEWDEIPYKRQWNIRLCPTYWRTSTHLKKTDVFRVLSDFLNKRVEIAKWEHSERISVQASPLFQGSDLDSVEFCVFQHTGGQLVRNDQLDDRFDHWRWMAERALSVTEAGPDRLRVCAISLVASGSNQILDEPPMIADNEDFTIASSENTLTASDPKRRVCFAVGRLKHERLVTFIADVKLRLPELHWFLHLKGLRAFATATSRESNGSILTILTIVFSRMSH